MNSFYENVRCCSISGREFRPQIKDTEETHVTQEYQNKHRARSYSTCKYYFYYSFLRGLPTGRISTCPKNERFRLAEK